MTAETAKKFEALEAQAAALMGVFTKAGYEAVAPAIIQPADVFLDVVGEDLRSRTYVFQDPEGAELCLRPDLTVPTCRLHWERHGRPDVKARYCYNGPAFRFQPNTATRTRPREFRQCGIESYGDTNRNAADVATIRLTIEALKAAGLTTYRVKIGDIGLFHALLRALEMPDRTRQRLRSKFWRPDAFRAELDRLVSRPETATDGLPPDLVATIDPDDRVGAEALILQYLADKGIEQIGWRTTAEIAETMCDAIATARSKPLSATTAEIIQGYLGVTAPAKAAGARLKDLISGRGVDVGAAIETYRNRLQVMTEADINCSEVTFSADFGRSIEYYTGFVFEVVSPIIGDAVPVAGGGRYDGVMRSVGADSDVPAVGASIHTERLLAAVSDTTLTDDDAADVGTAGARS